MEQSEPAKEKDRNRAYLQTHQAIIDAAVKLISEKGEDAVSIAGIAREMGIDRTTVYYHFSNRQKLMDAVSEWATAKIAAGMNLSVPGIIRAGQISKFVLENPSLTDLWINQFTSGGDIRNSYRRWDEMVSGVQEHFRHLSPDDPLDAEVYCSMMLAAAIVGRRVYAASVRPDLSPDEIHERFLETERRLLRRDGLLDEQASIK